MTFLHGFLFPIFVCIYILIGILYIAFIFLVPVLMIAFYYFYIECRSWLIVNFYVLLCICLISGSVFYFGKSDSSGRKALEVIGKPFISYSDFLYEQYPFMEDFIEDFEDLIEDDSVNNDS